LTDIAHDEGAEPETTSSEHKLASPISSPKNKSGPEDESSVIKGEDSEMGSDVQSNCKQTIIVKRTEFVTKYSLIMVIDQMTTPMHEKSTVFFVRSVDGEIPRNLRGNDHFAFNSYFEFSIISGEVLQGIADLVHQLYLPVIQAGASNAAITKDEPKLESTPSNNNDEANQIPTAASDDGETLRHELSLNVNKFEQQLRHVVQQTRGDTRIVIPNINLSNVEDITNNPHLIAELDLVLEEWSNVISSCIDQEIQLSAKMNRTPLGEIEYWRNRQLNVSSLYDQLNTTKVQQIINIMKTVENPQLASFNYQFGELSKLFLEARDNVKFLTTLERHFKHISEGTFQRVLESLPSMINGLRMVWVISRHYNTDERMAPLMEMISETFVRRIRDEIKLSNILSMEFVPAYRLVSEARDVLTQWSEQYFRMRKRIEETGSDHRWEFDRKALFGKTDYMSDVCGNILEIIDGLDRFKVFLGPELKAVTGDSAGIDEVLTRVENLAFSLKNSSEDKIFDKSYEKTWEQIMGKFRSTVLEIEKMTEQFIKESFRKLRSAEGAFELVKNFQKIGSNNSNQIAPDARSSTSAAGSIKQLISDRYNDILEQYARELDSIKLLFEKYRHRPMLYKNFPPVAGAIAWARDLYHRARRPIIRFKKHGGLLEGAYGERVKAQYLEFARAVDAYINELFTDWETNIAVSAVDKLRNSVLRSIAQYQPPVQSTGKGDKGSHTATVFLPPPPYRTNFPHDLKMIIKEARYLDKLGFQIPEGALNVTLQEKKYQDCVRLLNSKLADYDKILQSLKPVEKQLLKIQIDELNATIKTGFYPLNWTSQRIPAYIEDLNSALVRFSSIVSQVHKNSSMIEDILKKVSSTLLVQLKDFRQPDDTWHPLDITEFYDIMETNRNARLQSLVEEYNSIGESFLLKLEEVVAKTATGYSPVLAGYYHYWEKCVYNALVHMIIKSMSAILGLLQTKDGPTLFRVNVSLNGKDLVVSPSLTDVDKFLTKSVRNIAESARHFIRWMHGTCKLTFPSFFDESSLNVSYCSRFKDGASDSS
jgi:dynein heavy chain, axonemal